MQQEPHILAIDTSGRVGAVAIARGETLLEEKTLSSGMKHAVELMPAIRELMQKHNWKPEQLEHVYISTGPGSFTGLRISITIARSLSQALGAKLVAVSTLDVIACNAPADIRNIVTLLDAKRGQVFASRYRRDEKTHHLLRTADPALVDPKTFIEQTPDDGGIAVLGEGVEYHREALFSTNPNLIELPKTSWYGTAANVHALGWQMALREQFMPMEQLIPTYIRLAEAEEKWRKDRGLPIT